jgi:hypothetical protein
MKAIRFVSERDEIKNPSCSQFTIENIVLYLSIDAHFYTTHIQKDNA